jgi:hypothetical protein
MHRVNNLIVASLIILVVATGSVAQDKTKSDAARRSVEQPSASDTTHDLAPIISQAIQQLLAMQEGDDEAEWPYEGVYRVSGEIPIGYRIGGTAICAMALLRAPGYADDAARKNAIERAVNFIIKGLDHPLMNSDYDGGYDVRGWGYTYALTFFLELKTAHAPTTDQSPALPLDPPVGQSTASGDAIDQTIRSLIAAIEQTEIPQVGGWNYARGRGKDAVSPPSPFMTAPTLQSLFQARKHGFTVDKAVVNRGLDSLEAARTATGSFRYAGANGDTSRESVPGSIGRMLVAEATLHLAGRSNIANVRAAVDSFIVHWQWLEKRRAQQGTHVPPYGIAPYYFYYAHYYAAQAIELLPQHEREEYRRRLRELVMQTRGDHGTWNDRVFNRSANYGTAMSMMALLMPRAEAPAKWELER